MSVSNLTSYDTTSTILEFTVTFINSSSLSFEYCSMKYPIYLRGDYWFVNPPSFQHQSPYYPCLKLSINHVDDARTYDGRWSVVYLGTNESIGQPSEVSIDESIDIYIKSDKINYATDYATVQLKVHLRILHSRNNSASSMDPCNVMADLLRLFNSIEHTADVDIVSATELSSSVLRCHRSILCLRSPVFAAMFSHNMSESISNRIVMEDFEQHIIYLFVEYLYKDALHDIDSITSEDLKALVVISDKYQVSGLKDAAAVHLSNRISCLNVEEMSCFAERYDSHVMMNVCLLYDTSK